MWTESVKTTGGLASAENSDLRIQVSPGGDLAVASYLLKVARKNPGPNRGANVTYELSPTLIKRGGAWKIVHRHFQVVPAPKPASYRFRVARRLQPSVPLAQRLRATPNRKRVTQTRRAAQIVPSGSRLYRRSRAIP